MAIAVRSVSAPAAAVWSVLANGWLYPSWVVGAARMRAVEDDWPSVGAKLHHSVGSWPALVDDFTEVLASDPPHLLVLRARAWPLGEAKVEFGLEDVAAGGCRVTMAEEPLAGPARTMFTPVLDAVLLRRNRETLARLAALAEGGAGQ